MECEDAMRSKMTAIQRHGLSSQKMDRDGVARECIHYQNIEELWGFPCQRSTAVPFYDLDLRLRVFDVGERVFCDSRNSGVDFVEADAVAGAAIGCQGACAESDDANFATATLAAEANGKAHSRAAGVIAGWGVS